MQSIQVSKQKHLSESVYMKKTSSVRTEKPLCPQLCISLFASRLHPLHLWQQFYAVRSSVHRSFSHRALWFILGRIPLHPATQYTRLDARLPSWSHVKSGGTAWVMSSTRTTSTKAGHVPCLHIPYSFTPMTRSLQMFQVGTI